MSQKTWTFTLRRKRHTVAVAHLPTSGKGGIWVNGVLHRQKYTRFEIGSEHIFYIEDVPLTIQVMEFGYDLRINGHRYDDVTKLLKSKPDASTIDRTQQRRNRMRHQAQSMKADTLHTNQTTSATPHPLPELDMLPVAEQQPFDDDPLLMTQKLTPAQQKSLQDTLVLNKTTSYEDFLRQYEQSGESNSSHVAEDTNPTWSTAELPQLSDQPVSDETQDADVPHHKPEPQKKKSWLRAIFATLR